MVHAFHPSLNTLSPYQQDHRRHDSEDTNTTATGAAQLLGEERQQEIVHQSSTDVYSEPTVLKITSNNLPTLGLLTKTDDDNTHAVYVHGCQERTKLSRLPRWRSMIKNSVIRSVNDKPIKTKAGLILHIITARCRRDTHAEIRFAKLVAVMKLGQEEIPQLYFDQLRHINQRAG